MSRILIVAAAVLALAAPALAQESEPDVRLYDAAALVKSRTSRLDPFDVSDFAPLGIPSSRHAKRPWEWAPDSDGKVGYQRDVFVEIASSAIPQEDLDTSSFEPLSKSSFVAVRTSARGHEAVTGVLDALRTARSRSVSIEVVSLAIPAKSLDGGAVAGLNGTVATPEIRTWLSELDVHKGRRRSTLDAQVATWSVLREVRSVGYLAEYDVEIAQAASIGDPIALTAHDGVRAAIRPFPLRDGRHLLRVVASTGDLSTNRRLVSLNTLDLGQVELPEYRGGLVACETIAGAGQTRVIVLGSADGTEEALWRVLLLTPEAVSLATESDTFRVFAVGSLTSRDPARRFHWEDSREDEADPHPLLGPEKKEEPAGRMDAETLINLLMPGAETELTKEGSYLMTFGDHDLLTRTSPEGIRHMERALAKYERMALRPVAVRVRLVSDAPDSGTASQTLAQLSAPVVTGRDVALAAYRGISFVADYDVEVAQERRMADPLVRTARSGAFANVRVDPGAGGRLVLSLDLRVAAVITPPLALETGAADVGPIERITSDGRARTVRLSLVSGEDHTIALGLDPFDPQGKRTLRAVVRVDAE